MKDLKVGKLVREVDNAQITIKRAADGVGPTMISMSVSSERPVKRWFGNETLSHEKGAILMERFHRGAVPLLFNHDRDQVIGMVRSAKLDNNRLLADAEFWSTSRAQEVASMVEGGLRNVSIGYQPLEFLTKQGSDDYTVTEWEPMEISIVSVPADPTVGIGRAQDDAAPVRVKVVSTNAATAAGRSIMEQQQSAGANPQAPQIPHVEIGEDFDAAKNAKGRIETIRKLASVNDINDEPQVMHWIRSGKSWDSIADDIIKIKQERSKASPAVLGLSEPEKQRFSIVRAINAVVHRDWSKAGYEAEISRTTAQRMGKTLNEHSFMMPTDILSRVMIVGTATQGGYLVGTDQQAASFIELLRNRSVAFRMGATTLSGLQGSVTIPTQAAAGAVGWLLEAGTATANEMTVGQKTLTMKTLGGYMELSRNLLMQSNPSAESLVNSDLAAITALKLDAAVLAGTSTDSTVPLGIRYTSGLGTANPVSGSATVYTDYIKYQSTVAASNAFFPNFGYVCHPAIAGLLMGKFTNTTYGSMPIWEGGILDGRMVGQRAMSSIQITSGTMLGGDFSQVVVGEWGTVEIETNPYANFQAGIVGVRVFYSADVLVRYGAAFAIGTGITG